MQFVNNVVDIACCDIAYGYFNQNRVKNTPFQVYFYNFWWLWLDLNQRPKAYESSALPLSYTASWNGVASWLSSTGKPKRQAQLSHLYA